MRLLQSKIRNGFRLASDTPSTAVPDRTSSLLVSVSINHNKARHIRLEYEVRQRDSRQNTRKIPPFIRCAKPDHLISQMIDE